MQPEKPTTIDHFVETGIWRQPPAGRFSRLEVIGPDKAGDNGCYEIHRGSPDRLDGRRGSIRRFGMKRRRQRGTFLRAGPAWF